MKDCGIGAQAAFRTEYRKLAIAWEQAKDDPPLAYRLFKRLHELAKEYRSTDEGRAAIESLVVDQTAAVRLLAAAESLAWRYELALRRWRRLNMKIKAYMPWMQNGLFAHLGRASLT